MDIKDVSDLPPVGADLVRPARVESPAPISSETSLSQAPAAVEYDDLRVTAPARVSVELRKLNEVIEATNLATDAVTKIGQMLGGEATPTSSASSQDSDEGDAVSDKAGGQLRDGITTGSRADPSHAANPLSKNSIRVELEQTLGKTLELILPSSEGVSLGLDPANLSPKDLILDTVAKIEAARKGIEELRSKLAAGIGTLKGADEELNNPAATNTSRLRDVEQVSIAAWDAHSDITEHPELALGVVGDLQRNAPALLL